MLTRLKGWIEGPRRRKRERWEREQANLSKQDKQVIDQYAHLFNNWWRKQWGLEPR